MIRSSKIIQSLLILFAASQQLYSQSVETTGRPIAEIFTDFHYNFNDTTKHTGFDLKRAFLGYQFLPKGNFSAKLLINVGSPDDLANGSYSRRYAFFREASIAWSNNNLTITMGMTGTRIMEFQQKFWGKRYIANTFQSINRYGFVADLGITADYIINKTFQADITIMDGEGYSYLQADDNLKTSLGLTITPNERIAVRIYGDIQRQKGLWQPVLIGFIGYKNDLITIGGEIDYKSNIDLVEGHHAWGLSSTAGINISRKTEIFARIDYISSVVLPNDEIKWNYLNNGILTVAGVQYTFNQYVKVALDYQGTSPYTSSGMPTDLIYLNALFRF
jgi:hypothetical protein